MDTIRLQNMIFYGYHGVTEAEKETGRRFEVDCELKVDFAEPGGTDLLEDTVDYAAVYSKIEEIVTGKAYSLVERLALQVADTLLREFPIYGVTLRVRKRIPPIPGHVEFIEVEVTRSQPNTEKLLT